MEEDKPVIDESSTVNVQNEDIDPVSPTESEKTEILEDTVERMKELRTQQGDREGTTDESNQGCEEAQEYPCKGSEDQENLPDQGSLEAVVRPTEVSAQSDLKDDGNVDDGKSKTKDEDGESCSKEREVTASDQSGGDLATGAVAQTNEPSREEEMKNHPYYVKWITWKGLNTPIVTQNDNGPCPLLAIINILLLRRAIEFPKMQEMVTTSQLMEYLGDHVLREIPENLAEGAQRNFEQNMQDALSILPKLKTGLDVNVRFTGVADFEFTPECVVFDILNIHLYHGWLVDPQNVEYKAAIGHLSYNQLVEKVVASKESNAESHLASQGLFAESFLQETANQLTYHGLCELNAKVKEDELCVFFRNNHFSTLYKHQNELFVLLTDQGFLTEDRIVWQTLSNVDGDGVFVDCAFQTLPMKQQPASYPSVSDARALSQEDQDYMLALSLQSEQQQQAQTQGTSPETQPQQEHPTPHSQGAQEHSELNPARNEGMSEQELLDLQYAMQLQEEEQLRDSSQNRQPARSASRRQTPPPQQPIPVPDDRGRHDKTCVIL